MVSPYILTGNYFTLREGSREQEFKSLLEPEFSIGYINIPERDRIPCDLSRSPLEEIPFASGTSCCTHKYNISYATLDKPRYYM